MGVTKKPAVIAKTAPKKRGRPVGSKNKAPTKDTRPLVDQLQEALAIEMRTNQALQKLFDDLKAKVTLDKDVSILTRFKFLVTGRL
jgi:hypothetical protein